jgi:recombination protein RecA
MCASLAIANYRDLAPAARLLDEHRRTYDSAWSLDVIAGRFVEITGSAQTAALTTAAGLVLETQRRGEWAAWITGPQSTFFPPDFAASGIDLEALPVVRIQDAKQAWRAADTLLRCGGFALVVLDTGGRSTLPLSIQTRLAGLAKKHHAALLRVTRGDDADSKRGSLVSLRGETEKERTPDDTFNCTLRAVKDKQGKPGWVHTEVRRGPDGLC